MKSNTKALLFAGAIILLMIASLIITSFLNKIPSNDISVTGNTGGNLNNGGLFCELDGKIYFANSYDGNRMYSMNIDGSDMKKLTTSSVAHINGAGDYLYYFMDSGSGGKGFGYVVRTFGVYRSKTDGSNSACLVKDGCTGMQLVGDYLYYQRYNNHDFSKFHKIKTDKSEDVLVSDHIINPSSCHNGIIYFNGMKDDHNLYALDTRTDSISTLLEGNIWNPVYYQDYIYYMDLSSNYRLCRYSLSGNSIEILSHDRADTFNVGGSYINYQKNDSDAPALMRMGLDGSNPEVIAEGIYNSIHITSNYVYFRDFYDEINTYCIPANGPIYVSAFVAAKEAAFAQQ